MLYLRQATASQSVLIGPFVDSTDAVTAETALTIDAADIRLSKNGANIVGKNSGGGTHDELGYYTITLDATDTDTVGRLQIMVAETGALPVYHEFQVLEEAIYDGMFAASAGALATAAALQTVDDNVDAVLLDTAEIGTAGAGLTNINLPNQTMDITGNITGNLSGSVGSVTGAINTAAGTITTLDGLDTAQDIQHGTTQTAISNLNDPTAAVIADAVWDEAQAGHVTAGSFGEVATEVAAILVDTAEIGAAGAGLTAVPWNAAWDAEVQSEVTDALNAYDPPTRAELTSDIGTVTTAISGLENISAADVNAQVLDVLNTDTFAEPGQGTPGATITLAAKIGYLYKAWRNRTTQTATEYALYADDATTKDHEAIVSDNGTTFERGEVSTGA